MPLGRYWSMKHFEMMHWEDKPIGRQVRNGDRIAGNIVGVLKDFATSNAAYVAVQPMYATYLDRFPETSNYV